MCAPSQGGRRPPGVPIGTPGGADGARHKSPPEANEGREFARRCAETLDLALQRTAMYKSWRALDPGADKNLDERFAALPVLTKADIRAHFPKGLVPDGLDFDDAMARGEVGFVRTSGTQDEALTNIWCQRWWDASERASWRLNSVAARVATGSHREAILASALSVGPRSEGPVIARGARTLGRFLFLNEYGTPAQWPEGHERRMLEELADYRPAVLEANPSLLARLSRFASREGAAVFQPQLITLTYEFPSFLHLRAIREAFGSPIASSYGSTEAGYVFMECERGRLHQNAEFCRVDLLPIAAVQPGGIGRIIVTTLGNKWFPLLRFEIGDVGRLSGGPCPCGRGFGLTLSAVEGRLGSVCLSRDGRPVTHLEIDKAIAGVGGVEEYRLDQYEPGSASLCIVSGEERSPAAAREAGEAIRVLFGAGARIDVRNVPSLQPEKSGKFLLCKRWYPLETGGLKSAQGAASDG
jgi:phenylacetate-coenzyme A ligase PaaK-like adenylate-forming protein